MVFFQRNSDLPHLKDIKVMGYSLRSWDYRYTLWLGFNPDTFQVGASHYGTGSHPSLLTPLWTVMDYIGLCR